MLDLDGHLTGARAVVVGGDEVVLDPVEAVPGPAADAAEQHAAPSAGRRPSCPGRRRFLPSRFCTKPRRCRPFSPRPSSNAEIQIVDHFVRLRCASSQLCRISTAAAWSTTARWRSSPDAPLGQPTRRDDRRHPLVRETYRNRRHHLGQPGSVRRCDGRPPGPCRPARLTGRPTTTSTASCSADQPAEFGDVGRHRVRRGASGHGRRVTSGVARMPSGSDRATPTRT